MSSEKKVVPSRILFPFILVTTLSSVRASFVLPLLCFVVIAIFGFRTSNVHKHSH